MSYDNDYIILVDENGQPYIAHSAIGNAVKKTGSKMKNAAKDWTNHKYIAKGVDKDTGKTIYFYNQHDYDVWLQNDGKRTLRNRIQDRLGFDERSRRDEAKSVMDRHDGGTSRGNKQMYDRAQRDYEKTALGRMENLKNVGKKTLGEIRKGAKNAGKWLDDHDAGLTETVRYARNRNKVDQAERDRLHDEMVNSGRIGRLANRVGESNAAHRITDAAYNTVPKAAQNAVASIKERKQGATNAINDFIDTRVTGSSANAAKQQAQQDALMGLDDAIGQFVDANNEYEKSIASKTEGARGTLNSAVTKASEKLSSARTALSTAWNTVTGLFSKDEAAALQAQLDVNMGLDGSIGEWFDTHKVK